MNIVLEKKIIPTEDIIYFLGHEIYITMEKDLGYEHSTVIEEKFISLFKLTLQKEKGTFYVAKMGKEVVGVGYRQGNYLDSLFVKEKFQNQGIGTQIFREMLEDCKQYDKVSLNARMDAISLYQKFHFEMKEENENGYTYKMELDRRKNEG